MKQTRLINQSRLVRVLAVGAATVALCVGLVSQFSTGERVSREERNLLTSNAAYAAEWSWDGVRGVATLARNTVATLNAIFTTLRTWGLLFDYDIIIDGPVPGTTFYFDVYINDPFSARGTVDAAGVPYSNRIQLKDGGEFGEVVFQMFFDDPENADEGDGCLVIVKPYYFEAVPGTVFKDTGVFEVRVKKVGDDTVMYITVSGSPWKENPPTYVKSGRMKVVDDGVDYDITTLAYVHVDGTGLNTICSGSPPEAGDAFYTLAYIAKKESPHYSTALFGWDNAGLSSQVCSFFDYKYGHFNATSGFVCDGSDSVDCPNGAPYPLNGAVQSLYDGMDDVSSQEFHEATIQGLAIPFL
jgi:hypothetical protein